MYVLPPSTTEESMNLEIHKDGAAAPKVHIDISEVFPARYAEADVVSVCETEAQALYDALKSTLPEQTKAAFLRLIKHGELLR
jgi:hypothetical protein